MMDFETLRFFFIPWKIPENLLFDNGQQITKGKQKHPHLYYWEMKLIPYSSQIFTLKSQHLTLMQKVPFFHMK
jgi:ATP adenylyltransferase/5',5'''-P-1,P-4-tetraphosphate phosphorylase II